MRRDVSAASRDYKTETILSETNKSIVVVTLKTFQALP